jgi:hypothetical protein
MPWILGVFHGNDWGVFVPFILSKLNGVLFEKRIKGSVGFRGRRRPMKYTVIRLETLEMRVVEEVSREEVKDCREGYLAIIDMVTGDELSADQVDSEVR